MACPCELTGQRHPIAWGRPGWRTSSPQSSADAARACPRGSLCRLPLPLRECLEPSDDHREWVQPSLGGAVGADGFFGRLKTSEVLVLAVQLDLRQSALVRQHFYAAIQCVGVSSTLLGFSATSR